MGVNTSLSEECVQAEDEAYFRALVPELVGGPLRRLKVNMAAYTIMENEEGDPFRGFGPLRAVRDLQGQLQSLEITIMDHFRRRGKERAYFEEVQGVAFGALAEEMTVMKMRVGGLEVWQWDDSWQDAIWGQSAWTYAFVPVETRRADM